MNYLNLVKKKISTNLSEDTFINVNIVKGELKMKIIGLLIIFAIIGLTVGYFIFGQINGEFVSPVDIFKSPDNFFSRTINNLAGIDEIRQNILISGAIGAIIGIIIGAALKRNKKEN